MPVVPTALIPAAQARSYARIAAALLLVTMVAGGFGEFYVPATLIVASDAAATATNVVAHNSMFRLGFAAYLVEAMCDITLSLVFYMLLEPVRKDLALLAAFFGLVSTAVFAGAELFFFAATFILGGADFMKPFSPDQVNALGLVSLRFYGYGAGIFMAFYGTAAAIRGYLIYRSGYLPRVLGVLLMVAGLGFIVRNFVLVLAPEYASDLLLAPMSVAGLSLAVWFLVKGIDASKWEARARGAGFVG
jgi:hypothetical protein